MGTSTGMNATAWQETGRSDPVAGFGMRRPGLVARAAWRLAMRSSIPARRRKSLKRLAAELFPGPYDITAAGFDWRLYPESNYCDRVLLARRRLPEVEERAVLLDGLHDGDVFVDVGANIGTYTLDAARRVGPRGRVIAIEPNPSTLERLAFHIAANGADNVTVKPVAVAPRPGVVTLWRNAGSNVGHSSLLTAGAGAHYVPVEVTAMPPADILAEENVSHVAAMKVDVEGYEDQVITPLLEAGDASLWPDRIQVETVHRHLWNKDCVAQLKAVGYRTVLATGENEILVRGDEPA